MVFSQKLTSRYRELKHLAGDSILLMQVGAFMQVMDEVARMASGVTGLKLQMAGDVDAPMVGSAQGSRVGGQVSGGMDR